MKPVGVIASSIVAAVLMLLAGCSDGAPIAGAAGATSQPSATSTAGTPAAGKAATAPTASASVPTAPRSGNAPKFAACRRLDRLTATGLLGGTVAAGKQDRRTDLNGRAQVDGCIYESQNGAGISYLAWWSPQAPKASVVRRGLAPASAGATWFRPSVGDLAAGSQLATPSSVQVNASKGRLLVQVTVTGVSGSRARAAAITAAREAVSTS